MLIGPRRFLGPSFAKEKRDDVGGLKLLWLMWLCQSMPSVLLQFVAPWIADEGPERKSKTRRQNGEERKTWKI